LNQKKPTVEIRFHSGIMRERDDVNWILHFQSPFATAVAFMKKYRTCLLFLKSPVILGK
jgi:ribulose-5-phosphate 4-epimerase/fuculose-1-phosphate aldolase